MSLSTVLSFPEKSIDDVPRMLRAIADGIDAGEYGDAHNLAWVIDCGDGHIEVGLCGAAPEGGVTAYYLFGKAMRQLEAI